MIAINFISIIVIIMHYATLQVRRKTVFSVNVAISMTYMYLPYYYFTTKN